MLSAAVTALSDLVSPPLRAVLLKSIGLALVLLIVIGIALQQLLAWLLGSGAVWVEGALGGYQGPIGFVQFMLALIASLGVIAGLVFLMPAVTALVASLFADEIAEQVERAHYPPPGRALPVWRALVEGLKTAFVALLIYLCAVPFLLLAGLGVVIFFVATAFLLGREYFELAAMRFHDPQAAKALRKRHQSTVWLAGMLIAAFVSIPIVNLATPLFATALMVHMHKRLTEPRRPAPVP